MIFDELKFGAFSFLFPIPEGFSWVYPARCGYNRVKSPGIVSARPDAVLLLVTKGEGAAFLCGQHAHYRPGDIIVSQDASALEIRPREESVYLYLLLKNAGLLVDELMEEGFFLRLNPDNRAETMFYQICRSAQKEKQGSIYDASRDAYGLFMELLSQSRTKKAQYGTLVYSAIELIRKESTFLAGVDELADKLGVSKNHLIRKFTAETGQSPGRYLQQVRVENAKLLLINQDYTVDVVASMVGYSGANYFCKVFRRLTGQSPGEYRMRYQIPMALDNEQRRQSADLEEIHYV